MKNLKELIRITKNEGMKNVVLSNISHNNPVYSILKEAEDDDDIFNELAVAGANSASVNNVLLFNALMFFFIKRPSEKVNDLMIELKKFEDIADYLSLPEKRFMLDSFMYGYSDNKLNALLRMKMLFKLNPSTSKDLDYVRKHNIPLQVIYDDFLKNIDKTSYQRLGKTNFLINNGLYYKYLEKIWLAEKSLINSKISRLNSKIRNGKKWSQKDIDFFKASKKIRKVDDIQTNYEEEPLYE